MSRPWYQRSFVRRSAGRDDRPVLRSSHFVCGTPIPAALFIAGDLKGTASTAVLLAVGRRSTTLFLCTHMSPLVALHVKRGGGIGLGGTFQPLWARTLAATSSRPGPWEGKGGGRVMRCCGEPTAARRCRQWVAVHIEGFFTAYKEQDTH